MPGTGAPACTWWNAKRTFVADGDTIRVHIAGDRPGRIATIRFTGINAMELHRYSARSSRRRGDCHSVEAAALVDSLLERAHGRVRLAAQDPSSVTGGRLRRSVWVRSGGRWQDVARLELQAGLALWLPNAVEHAHNADYSALSQAAAAAHLGLYAPSSCGAGPDDDIPLAVDVNWDADGADGADLNGEWVQIRNLGARPLALAGWWLRDSWLRVSPQPPHRPGYEFPAPAVIPPGGAVRVHSGCGADDASAFHWCQKGGVFDNASTDGRHMGDGAYLFDPQGDLRASEIYPCLVACQDPLQGKVRIAAHPTTPESISVSNAGTEPVDLTGHVVKLHLRHRPGRFIFSYAFPVGSVIAPGQTMELLPQGSPAADEPLVKHLARRPYALADTGGAVSLRSFTDVVVDCYAWGDGGC
ncbi:lamin tail domain-containing protein [Candidatus Solirubrobacter pratensis]|uniref:lamin tail domain-containing protein n=1 Tax=Candidatus Solirubrobacter pratensis TaxID=1298857 RepID=UPI00041B4AAF|nr:lamin tail domain-containing protein [Candidatus Solirubrobacter pratensis]